ncbi:MAG: SH3 domain-containing protein [Chloroflexota bacterium]
MAFTGQLYRRLLLVVLVMSAAGMVLAQAPGDSNVQITFPPPVFVLGGEAEIIGTANADGQATLFIEYQVLGDDLLPLPGTEEIWLPATLPVRGAVIDDVLGVWDTTLVEDGIYAIRLSVATSTGVINDVVSPIRVDNSTPTLEPTPGTLDEDESVNNALLALTATAAAFSGNPIATPPPVTGGSTAIQATPTAFDSGALTAEVLVVANLRDGDSTLYGIEAGLQPGTELTVLGRSSRGTNWLFVITPDGEQGWVAPSVVNIDFNILDAPEIEPPPVPVTPTPTPTDTPNAPDANVISVSVDRDIEEDEPFQVIVTMRNDGGVFLGTSQIFCNVEPQNVEVTFTGGGLNPGAQGQFVIPLRVDSGGGQNVRIVCQFDPNQNLSDVNRDNNTSSLQVFLDD